jgi:hypothetical protein
VKTTATNGNASRRRNAPKIRIKLNNSLFPFAMKQTSSRMFSRTDEVVSQ